MELFSFKQPDGSRVLAAAALIVSLMCCSCSSTVRYRNPPGTPEQLATIRAAGPVWINSIDGRRTTKGLVRGTRAYRLTPGAHVIEVSFGSVSEEPVRGQGPYGTYQSHDYLLVTRSRGRTPLRLNAKAGETYDIDYALARGHVRFFIPQLVTFQDYEPNQTSH